MIQTGTTVRAAVPAWTGTSPVTTLPFGAVHRACASGSSAAYPPTVCDPRAVATARRAVESLYGPDAWLALDAPVMGAEDFSYMLEKVPGAMLFLGASAEGSDWRQCCALHSNRMVLDEKIMTRGAALHVALAERFLAEGFGD